MAARGVILDPAKSGPPEPGVGDAEAATILERWKEGSEAIQAERRDYWINLAFFLGEQWIWWDRRRAVVQSLPQAWSPLGPGRAKLTINRIEVNLQSVLGRMLKADLGFEVPPSDSSDDVIEGARTAEKVLEAYHRDQSWEDIRHDEVLGAFLGGTSAVSIDWDASKGQMLEYDNQLSKVVGTGELKLSSHSIAEFCVEPNVRDAADSRWWCSGMALPPKYVKDYYGLGWTPSPDAGALMSPLQQKLLADGGNASGRNLTLVLTYFERPMNRSKGRVVCVVNGRTVSTSDWPFPFDELNLHVFRQKKLPSRWTGWTMMNSARQVQFAYNHARSVLSEHMKLTGNARLMAPQGAFVEEDFTDDPSGILFYTPDVAGGLPAYLTPPQLPRWLIQEADTLKGELDDIMYAHGTSRGEATFDRASGQALALLSEKDDSPLGIMAREQKRRWQAIAKQALQMLEDKATETRSTSIKVTKGITEKVDWNGKMLRGQTDVEIPLENVMPHSGAARQAFAKDLWDRQILTDPRKYARMVGLPAEEFEELMDPDAARANRENYRMMMGEVEFPETFDDNPIHISEHNRLRKSDTYKYAPAEIKKLVDDHIALHEHYEAEQLASQMQKAQVNPALAAMAQGDAPPGSLVPMTAEQQQAQMASQGVQGAQGGGATMNPTAGAPVPAMAAGSMDG